MSGVLQDVFDAAPQAMILVDRQGAICHINRAAKTLLGRGDEDLVGLLCGDAARCVNATGGQGCGRDSRCAECVVRRSFTKTFETGQAVCDAQGRMTVTGSRSLRDVEFLVTTSLLGGTGPSRVLVTLTDIIRLKQEQREREMSLDLLRLANSEADLHQLLREMAARMQQWVGCDAAGIRLHDGEDYPYFESRGFPPESLQAENSLCAVDQAGERVRDGQGNPVIECMCGNVIQGRFDPTLPFFTPGGSFWTNSTTQLLASTTEKDRQGRTRNRCNRQGYESVALIPLRIGREPLGLLQICDRRKDLFTLDRIAQLERLASSVASGLAQRQAARSLKQSEEKFRLLANFTHDWEYWHDNQGRFLFVSLSVERITGYRPEEFMADPTLLDRIILQEDLAAIRPKIDKALAENLPLELEFRIRHRDGREVWIGHACMVVHGPDGEKLGRRATNRDVTERKRAEESLRLSEERFRTLVEHAKDGVCVQVASRWVYVNPAAMRLFGATAPEQLLGQPVYDRFHPDCRDNIKERIRLLNEEKKPVPTVEQVYLRLDGTPVPVEVSAAPIECGGESGAVVFIRDITDRKRAEAALRESKARLDLALSSAGMGTWRLEFGEDKGYFDDQVCHLFGVRPPTGGWTAEDFFNIVHPDDRERVKAATMQMIARNVPFEVEYRVVWPDGSIHHIAARGRVLRDNEGRPLRINGLVWDITPQKQAEEALRESEDRYRSLVENVGLGVTLIGADYRIRSVNPAQARLFGKAPEQLIGKECFREFEKRNSICPHCPGKIAMETGRPAETEQQGIHDDGLTHMARVQAYPMLDSSGRTTGVIAVTEDITQQRQLEAQYRQAQKMEAVGRLAAGVAHDFNNQLTIILGYCELLLKDGKGGDALREAMKQIHQAACRAQSTTSHLLSFSRKQILRPEVVDPGELLQEMRNPVSRMIGEDVQLQVVASPGVPSIFVDKSGLQQAIMNLVVNARDAMPKGGQLVIRTSRVELGQSDAAQYPEGRAGQWVLLEVIDTGVGMDRQTLDRVFDPFFTTKEVGKGTGLGAPMVQGFISQSHGFMGYATEVGKGTTVRLFLPPADSVVTQENAATVAPPASSKAKETILVVEDEEGVRQFIVRALQQQGYQIIEAASPAEALELVCQEACHFDLLVTDVVMPEMTGYELAERLKVGRKSLAVLFVTGYTDEPPTEGAMVLHKPFSLEKLMAGVEQSLASRRRRRKAT